MIAQLNVWLVRMNTPPVQDPDSEDRDESLIPPEEKI